MDILDNMSKHEVKGKKKRKRKNKLKSKAIIALLVVAGIFIFNFAFNNVRNEKNEKTNFMLDNKNVTASLKKEILIENGVIYLSKEDVTELFNSNIYYDEKYDQIITSSYDKLAAMPIGKTQIQVNSSNTKVKSGVIEKNDTYYIPISELENVYNVKVNYSETNNIVIIDSLDKDYVIATASKDSNVKYEPTNFSKTVAKVKKGEICIIANREEYPVSSGWTRVRTEDGILGYVKKNRMGPENYIREAMEESKKIEEPVKLVKVGYSEYSSSSNRKSTKGKDVNVVSPTFFTLKRLGKGQVEENVGSQGKKYIEWAKGQGYQVWANISNNSYTDTTSEIMKDYKLREKLINQIVDYITQYQLDGINISFEEVYEEDKDYFSCFLKELKPRLNEIGAILSIDITALKDNKNWDMYYDKDITEEVADYIHGT